MFGMENADGVFPSLPARTEWGERWREGKLTKNGLLSPALLFWGGEGEEKLLLRSKQTASCRSPKPVCLTKLPGFTIPIFGYLPGVPTLSEKPESLPALNQVVVCDFGESSLGQAAFGRVDEPRLFEINF